MGDIALASHAIIVLRRPIALAFVHFFGGAANHVLTTCIHGGVWSKHPKNVFLFLICEHLRRYVAHKHRNQQSCTLWYPSSPPFPSRAKDAWLRLRLPYYAPASWCEWLFWPLFRPSHSNAASIPFLDIVMHQDSRHGVQIDSMVINCGWCEKYKIFKNFLREVSRVSLKSVRRVDGKHPVRRDTFED